MSCHALFQGIFLIQGENQCLLWRLPLSCHITFSFVLWVKNIVCHIIRVSQIVLLNLPANAGDERDAGSILGLGRSPGRGNGNPLQNSCLRNLNNRGGWQSSMTECAYTRFFTNYKAFMCHWHAQLWDKNFAVLDMFLKPLVLTMILQQK